MKRALIAAALVLASVATATADERIISFSVQTTTPTNIEPGQSVRLAWFYPNVDLTNHPVKFRLYLDGIVVKNFVAADLETIAGTTDTEFRTKAGVLPSFTTAQVGKHTWSLTAYDDIGLESGKTDLAITVGWTTAPKPPSGFKLFTPIVAMDPLTGEVRIVLVPIPSAGGQ